VKVIFIDDVPYVAMAGETKEVADGYARNYLLPKKLAVLANSAASNIVQAQMKKVEVKRAQAAAEMSETAKQLEGTEITIKAKVGEKERLYGSVTSADIAAGLAGSTGLEVDKRKIDIEEPIRELGTHEVTIKFTHDITAAIKVAVVPDEVIEEKPEKEERKPRAKKAEDEEVEEAVAEAEAEVAETEDKVEEPVAVADEPETEAEAEAEAIEAELEDK
jgi:large subunit ribosomal protein L9